jgi:DNA-binding NarL/FixJ family response regulator
VASSDQEHAAEHIRLLLADDHRLFREGVASVIERAPDIELVGQAATGEDAVRLVAELNPDVVLMDLQMPGAGGIAATGRIVKAHPSMGVIVLTMFEDDELVFAAIRAGARGYVLKDADRGSLLRAIRAVANGEALLGHVVAQRVLQHFAGATTAPVEPPKPEGAIRAIEGLTPRESEVLHLIARGVRNRDIAEQLVITEKTLSNHISNIFSKLQVADRAEAIVRAREAGLGR